MTTITKPPSPRIAYRLDNLPPLPSAPRQEDRPHIDEHPQEAQTRAEPARPEPRHPEPPRLDLRGEDLHAEDLRPERAEARPQPRPDVHALAGELARSLQLSRASALALTRLQLAIKSNDRRQAMEALDRLHAIDADLERLTDRLPAPPVDAPDWPEWEAIARHLDNQKLALAFEKLALASEISGPDLVSARRPQDVPLSEQSPEADPETAATAAREEEPLILGPALEAPPPLSDWPRLPAVQQPAWKKNLAIRIAGVVATLLVMLAVAAVAVTMMGVA